MDQEKRIVVLIDMDCFYCQVEEKLNPELQGKPIAVVQYNPWKGGGIIAVNYEARARGVTRHMRGDEAKEKCPEIELPSVPCQRGKADITKYRDAGKEVAKILQRFTPLMERASIDEAYLDITEPVSERMRTSNVNTVTSDMLPNSFALGYDDVREFVADVQRCGGDSISFDYQHSTHLLVGAVLVSEIRAAVYNETGYRCSAGIAHNKILAKLVCGMNKPNKQTVLPKHCVDILYKTLPVKKVKHLGGKFGDNVCDVLRIKYMAELQSFSEKDLQTKFDEKNGSWLYNIARGINSEPVQARFNPKSIGCCKNFKGKAALIDLDSLKKWLKDLGDEIEDRLEKDALENNRTPKQMVVSFAIQVSEARDTSSSRSYNFQADDELCGEMFSNKAYELVSDSVEGCKPKDDEVNRRLKYPIKFLGISVGKFEDQSETKKTRKIKDYFTTGPSKESPRESRCDLKDKDVNELKDRDVNESKPKNVDKSSKGKEYILQKFFQAGSSKSHKEQTKEISKETPIGDIIEKHETVLHTPLEKQESFFAIFLNKDNVNTSNEPLPAEENDENICKDTNEQSKSPIRNGGDDSDETNYSASTINEEINKSIALFEDDPEYVNSVRNMRQLLTSTKIDKENRDSPLQEKESVKETSLKLEETKVDMFKCNECGKELPMTMFVMHSDYHLALKLREEERENIRREIKEKNISKEVVGRESKKKQILEESCNKNQNVSIANFLTKLDSTVPSKNCPECGMRVANEKLMEHLDFHEAQKLSRQINNRSIADTSGLKRKRKSTSPTKKSKVPCKSIDLFFK